MAPLDTTELAPGARVPTLAHTVGRLRPSVVRDLDLKGHGLSSPLAHRAGLRAVARRLGGHALRRRRGHRRGSPRAARARDADAYAGFDRQVRALGRFLADLGDETPPDIQSPGFGDALAGPQARSDLSRPRQARRSDACCGSCPWPSPTSWLRPSRPTPSRQPSPGGACATRTSVPGRAARRRSC